MTVDIDSPPTFPLLHGVYPNIVIKHSSIHARRPRTILIIYIYYMYIRIYVYSQYPRPHDEGICVRHDEDPGDRRAERESVFNL